MTRLLRSRCPWCGHRHELATAVTTKEERRTLTEEPTPGVNDSFSFCMGCGEVAVFDLTLPGKLRFPTMEEATLALTDRRILDLSLAWNRGVEQLGRKPRPITKRPEWMNG